MPTSTVIQEVKKMFELSHKLLLKYDVAYEHRIAVPKSKSKKTLQVFHVSSDAN